MEYYNVSSNVTVIYDYCDYKKRVGAIDNWMLMSSPLPILAICVVYMVAVLKVGPAIMKNRAPLNLKNILGLYNAIQVLASLYLFRKGTKLLMLNGITKSNCSTDDNVMYEITSGIYLYFLAKISELLDTIFFTLRKKQNQVTFLHVYHHTSMIITTWFSLKYDPSYSVVFLGTANSFVHVIMYTYYGLSAFPSLAKYLWWKKYITVIQLVQFFLVLANTAMHHIYGCPLSTFMFYIIMCNGLLFIYLFGDFYIKSYLKQSKLKNKVK